MPVSIHQSRAVAICFLAIGLVAAAVTVERRLAAANGLLPFVLFPTAVSPCVFIIKDGDTIRERWRVEIKK